MEFFPQYLVNGIVFGSVYALFSIGFTIIYSIMGVFNLAHGEFYMIGAFIAWLVIARWIPNYWLALILATVGGALLGFIAERMPFRLTYGKVMAVGMLVAMGLMILLQEAMFLMLGGAPQRVWSPYTTLREIGNVLITDERLIIIGLTLVVLAAVFLFFQRTKTGKAIRAAAQNKLGATLLGIDVNQMARYGFIGGIALAGFAGALLSPITTIYPWMGGKLLALCLTIMVVAGLRSIGGVVIIAYAIGIIESLFGAYVSLEWSYAVGYGFLLIVLLFRPRGLFGKE